MLLASEGDQGVQTSGWAHDHRDDGVGAGSLGSPTLLATSSRFFFDVHSRPAVREDCVESRGEGSRCRQVRVQSLAVIMATCWYGMGAIVGLCGAFLSGQR